LFWFRNFPKAAQKFILRRHLRNLKTDFSSYVSGQAIIIHSTSKIINFTLKISFIGTQKYGKNMKGKISRLRLQDFSKFKN